MIYLQNIMGVNMKKFLKIIEVILFSLSIITLIQLEPYSISTYANSNEINSMETADIVNIETQEIVKINEPMEQPIKMVETKIKQQVPEDRIIVENPTYVGYITEYMDLKVKNSITINQMNDLINYWLDGRESKFINTGDAFIEASKITGLDPIFLLALAAQESGWEVSDLHSSKNNPYSINMVDDNPHAGYEMGDSFKDGIINGAIWIKENYYNIGETTLYSMIYGGLQYSSATDQWIYAINSIMDTSYKYLYNY